VLQILYGPVEFQKTFWKWSFSCHFQISNIFEKFRVHSISLIKTHFVGWFQSWKLGYCSVQFNKFV
jgi:hypothetical protein